MAQSSWRNVKSIFHAALDVAPAELPAYLTKACRGDEELRAEVESLLKADGRSLPWLDAPVYEAAAQTLARETASPDAERIFGAYRIVRQLGQGGMGKVFLAARADDQYQSRVAVKLVRQDYCSEEIVSRFRQERQILASLDHPNIARLLDGGVTEDALPYFIMDYVDGVPIDAFCDRNQPSIAERIELFRTVCSAVHYAHRHLVVHCDLKPSNILVTADGVPKLLDFGIARLMGSEHIPRVVTVTMFDSRRLTPAYASPEQVRGERLTTASDVYSLGVLLYRLLTHRLPFRFRERVLREIERVICEEEPTRPSAAVEALPSTGERRRESPEKLRRLLTGDLDNIVLMAMRKDPARRYGSAEQLSEDLRRHQVGLPVLARKDTLTYRVSKFVRRHRAWVAAAGLVSLSLLLGIVTTTRVAFVAMEERAKAERERARAEKVSDFLERLFKEADPKDEELLEDLTVRELLKEGSRQIEQDLADQPEVQARLLTTLGVANQHLGYYEEAAAQLETALELRRRGSGPDTQDVAESLDSLCSLRRETSDYEAALPVCRQALALWRQTGRDKTHKVVRSLNRMALLLRGMGQYEEAELYYREGLEIGQGLLGEEAVEVAIALHNLGGLLRIQGEFDKAEHYLHRAVQRYRELLGPKHPHVASGLNTLAALAQEKGDLVSAEGFYREALDIRRKIDPEHPDVATTLTNLAGLRYLQKDYAVAETLYQQALDLFRKHRGEERREVVIILNQLGALRRAMGDSAVAVSYYRQALELGRRRFGLEHPTVAVSLIGLGRVLTELGEYREAEGLLIEGLRIREVGFSAGHWRIANARSLLGACLTSLGRFEEAEVYLLESYRVLTEQRGERHRLTLEALERVIALYEAWSRPEEAESYRVHLQS